MAAPTFVAASTGATDATGAWTATGSAGTSGNIVILQVVQDGATGGAVTLTSATNIEDLAGTDNQWTSIGAFPVGGAGSATYLPDAIQHLWIGRLINTSAPTASGGNSTSEDLYWRFYEFSNVSTGATLATVIENYIEFPFVSQIGSFGTGNDQFDYPYGICVSPDGTYLYVVDGQNDRIVKRLASDLSYVSQIGSTGTGNDQFSYPHGICVNPDGTYLYVADSGNERIVKRLASDLSYVSQIGSLGTGNDQFDSPEGLSTDGTYLYVADNGNDRIVKRLASDLSYVSQIGSTGTGNDQFNGIYDVEVNGTYLYVADSGNDRIVKRLASDLSYVSKIGSSGTGNDQFNAPYHITTDGTYLYVADYSNERIVKRLASDLSYVSKWGSHGSGRDQFYWIGGLALYGSNLYVTEMPNNRIVKRSTIPDHSLPSSMSQSDGTVQDAIVTTLGPDRLALNFVAINDDNAQDPFTGETGGDWIEATSEYAESSGTDASIGLQISRRRIAQTTGGIYFSCGTTSTLGKAQSFLSPGPESVSQVTLYLNKTGTPTDSVYVDIRSDASGEPASGYLGRAEVLASSISSGGGSVTVTFSGVHLSASETYYITVTRSGSPDSSHYYGVSETSPSAYPDGQSYGRGVSGWSAEPAYDFHFVVDLVPGPSGTIDGGTFTNSDSADSWGVVGFALIGTTVAAKSLSPFRPLRHPLIYR